MADTVHLDDIPDFVAADHHKVVHLDGRGLQCACGHPLPTDAEYVKHIATVTLETRTTTSEAHDAAALWGVAENRAYTLGERLRAALQALKLIFPEGDLR